MKFRNLELISFIERISLRKQYSFSQAIAHIKKFQFFKHFIELIGKPKFKLF